MISRFSVSKEKNVFTFDLSEKWEMKKEVKNSDDEDDERDDKFTISVFISSIKSVS